jgi:hypothetical protein
MDHIVCVDRDELTDAVLTMYGYESDASNWGVYVNTSGQVETLHNSYFALGAWHKIIGHGIFDIPDDNNHYTDSEDFEFGEMAEEIVDNLEEISFEVFRDDVDNPSFDTYSVHIK